MLATPWMWAVAAQQPSMLVMLHSGTKVEVLVSLPICSG